MGKAQRKLLQDRIQNARQNAASLFQKPQRRVNSSFRAVKRTQYEKKYPGRIARAMLPCRTIQADGKKVEVVLLRTLPKGEWQVDFEDVKGVGEEEVYDDGMFELRAGQANAKYKALAQKSRLTEQELENADVVPSDDSEETEQEYHKDDEADESMASDSENDGLAWATSCLLDDDFGAQCSKQNKVATPTKAVKALARQARSGKATSAPSARLPAPAPLVPHLSSIACALDKFARLARLCLVAWSCACGSAFSLGPFIPEGSHVSACLELLR